MGASPREIQIIRTMHIPDDSVECRACGATHAAPHDNPFGICASCYTALGWPRSHRSKITEADFLAWLAHKLKANMKRLQSGRSIARCQAISIGPLSRGYQCAHMATVVRDGWHVCHSHVKSTHPVYVGEPHDELSEYSRFSELLKEVADRDPDFKKAVQAAIS